MTTMAEGIIKETTKNIFGREIPMSLDYILNNFAFDIKLPSRVTDAIDKTDTWVALLGANNKVAKFETIKKFGEKNDWLLPTVKINSMDDILDAWDKVNFVCSERNLDSTNVYESDCVYGSENVIRSIDIHESKNIIYCNGIGGGGSAENTIASFRSRTLNNCIKIMDSQIISKSYMINLSGNLSQCFFISESTDLLECMFCNNLNSKQYCIANMQFEKEEYMKIKSMVIDWIAESVTNDPANKA